MAETITLNELKPGDIVLFSIPEHSWISSIIGFLTHSEVSHTAMVDFNPAYILEEGGEGAAQSPLPDPGTRTLYIRRLNNSPDTTKVDDIAMKYVKEKLPYPMSNLVFLGLYIIAGDFIPDTIAGDIINNILRLATYELMKLVNNKTHPGTDVPPKPTVRPVFSRSLRCASGYRCTGQYPAAIRRSRAFRPSGPRTGGWNRNAV